MAWPWCCRSAGDKSPGMAAITQSKMFIFISLIIRIDPFHTNTAMFSYNIHLFVSWSIWSDTCNSHKLTPTPPRKTHTLTHKLTHNWASPKGHPAKGHNYPGSLWHSCLRVRRKCCPPPASFSLLFACVHTHTHTNTPTHTHSVTCVSAPHYIYCLVSFTYIQNNINS